MTAICTKTAALATYADTEQEADSGRRVIKRTIEIGPGRTDEYDGPATIEVELTTYHSKERKQYFSSVSRQERGKNFVRYALFQDTARIPATVPVARHSMKAMQAAHDLAVAWVDENRDHEKIAELHRPV